MKKILIVDDDAVISAILKKILRKQDWEITCVETPERALRLAGREIFDLLITDINLDADKSGFDLLRIMREICPVILVTAYGSLETAVEASREGAWDIISKPFQPEEVIAAVRRALEKPVETKDPPIKVISSAMTGSSPAMVKLYKKIARVAPVRSTVLILGESGTGKELVARAIHQNSSRRELPFVAVNCGALTENLLESELFGYVKGAFTGASTDKKGLWKEADGGTLFLDEVGEINLPMQVKLLRALQEGEIRPVGSTKNTKVNARIIAATNRDLESEVENGNFREDLFYRLSVFTLRVPPLRDRQGDIPLLAERFLQTSAEKIKRSRLEFSGKTLDILNAYDWRGNVRELEAAIEYAALHARGGKILPEDLPAKISFEAPPPPISADSLPATGFFQDLPTLNELEKRYLLYVLKATNGNRTRAAATLDIDRRTLYRKLERFGVSLEDKKSEVF